MTNSLPSLSDAITHRYLLLATLPALIGGFLVVVGVLVGRFASKRRDP